MQRQKFIPGISMDGSTCGAVYQSVLTKDTCKALMDKIGLRYDIVESTSKSRIRSGANTLVIAYDSTTEGNRHREDNARCSFNKDIRTDAGQ